MPATYVKSVNGMTGEDRYEFDKVQQLPGSTNDYAGFIRKSHSRNKDVVIDSGDIHISGSTGDTIRQKCSQIASGIQMLTMESTGTQNDYRLLIQSGYPLAYTN